MKDHALAVGPSGSFGVWAVEGLPGQPVLSEPEPGAPPTFILVPGFVDLHIHGAFGLDFMRPGKGVLEELSARLAAKGYEAYLPTTVTCTADEALEALAWLPEDNPMIPGFHLEGPFISPQFAGAQPPEKIALPPPPGEGSWAPVLGRSDLKLITIAPEVEGALPLITWLAERGVRASMGHTAATFAEAERGIDAGICHATHTFNAMKGLHHREAGALGAALSDPRVDCELIYDRVHVSPPAARLLLAAKGFGRAIAVSDSSLATGLAEGAAASMWGHDVVISEGEVRLKSTGALAGSTITLLEAFRRLAEDFGPEAAIRLCSINPRRAIGMGGNPRVWLRFGLNLEGPEIYSC